MSMVSPRPQLNSDEMRRLKWLLGGMLALVSLWTVFFLDVEALSLVVFASLAVLAVIIWPQLPAHIPVRAWRLAVPAIIVAVITDFYFSADTLPALIRLAILLMLYRAVSYRRKREDLQLIVLGLFLIVVAGVLTVSLGFAFLLLLFTACALGFLFSVTLIDMTDTGPKVMRPEEMQDVPSWAKLNWRTFLVRLRQVMDWRLIGFAAGLFVLVVSFSAILFTVIPRFEIGNSFLLDKYITRKTRTGFSDTIKFGDVSELVRDEGMALRVDLTDAASLREMPYWRMVVLDEYTKQGFQMSLVLRKKLSDSQQTRQIIAGRRGLPVSATVGGLWKIYVEPGVSRFLPIPGSFDTLRMREPQPIQRNREQRLFALRSEPMAMTAFQLEGVTPDASISDPEFAEQMRALAEAKSLKESYARINMLGPAGEENETALRHIVNEITAGEETDAHRFVQKATDWLRAKHSYALSSRIPAGTKDDILKWLESNEPGFCEYYAAGLTVLCRAAGFPARVVAGFRGGSLNAFEQYYMVKNSSAHAWTEVFDGRGEWFRADAVPGAIAQNVVNATGATQRAQVQEKDNSWSARLDSLRMIWYRRIVNFDTRQQVEIIDNVKAFTGETGDKLKARLENIISKLKAWLAGPWNFSRAGKVIQLIAALGLMLWALARAWHWTKVAWRMWRQPANYDPVRNEAGHWLEKLSDRGVSVESADESFGQVHGELLRLRYGHRETWPEPRNVFRRARKASRSYPTQRKNNTATEAGG